MAFHHSLEVDQGSKPEKDSIIRTGTTLTCTAHIITAVIGSGVLSLAWATAQLGWIAAPICMLSFAIVTYISAFLLSECYRTSTGERNRSYMEAVRFYLGTRRTWFCGFLQYVSFYGCAVVYTFTTATCVRAIQKSNCYHKEGHQAPCSYGDGFYMILFGLVQIVLCLIPDFHEMAWLSILAAIMSFAYSSIGFGLGLAKVIGNGRIKGSIGGIAMPSATQKVWRVSQALGDIAFAYPYSIILLEIEDTLKSPPPENKTMKKASMVAVFITTFFYLCCGCFGYAAFGDETPGNLLTGFGFYEPYWLVDFANLCVVIHLVGGYQVYSQPIFSFVDRWSAEKFPESRFVNKFYTVKLPFLPPYRLNLLRLCFRTIYVITTTGLALFFPFFNQVLGLLGSFSFWPLAIYFPVEMYFVQRKVAPWTKPWIVLQVFSAVCLIVSIFAFVGSVEGVISAKLS
ncbi:Amino acid permease 2 [Rhynchospora pubera]|uniref:Amino acid permease 2 n=1 Tax=Rhynchospora pubera TaxID=906938 RepID=A0AAV8CCI0_9POAL|nr:Amino acid permease 2 [Rhynchospora pubera]